MIIHKVKALQVSFNKLFFTKQIDQPETAALGFDPGDIFHYQMLFAG